MKRAVLARTKTSDQGTFGVITVEGRSWFTGELPARDNQNDISRIPAGAYTCQWTMSFRFRKRMWELTGVPGRAGIRIHSANFMGAKDRGYRCQLNGCIALGKKLGTMDGQAAIFLSSTAVREFEEFMGTKPFTLEVKDEPTGNDR